jgi:hypothetical protein
MSGGSPRKELCRVIILSVTADLVSSPLRAIYGTHLNMTSASRGGGVSISFTG